MQNPPLSPHYRRRRTFSTTSSASARPSALPKLCTDFSRRPYSSTVRISGKDAYGAFTPTTSAFPSLLFLTQSTPPQSPIEQEPYRRRRVVSTLDPYAQSMRGSPASSSDSIPSFSRTSSSLFSEPMSNVEQPAPSVVCQPSSSSSVMNPILADLERKSKFCTSAMTCASCHMAGSQFPRCPKCSLSFCSRHCRLDTTKHLCAAKKGR
ncbi:hypothetical protein DL96DRAFT_1737916 [Flagelloscypha sp. PMI_526]|nr:hypothetical protein DL96DRAFT_1737916 [Flagelloscypha sp. PMI_526]